MTSTLYLKYCFLTLMDFVLIFLLSLKTRFLLLDKQTGVYDNDNNAIKPQVLVDTICRLKIIDLWIIDQIQLECVQSVLPVFGTDTVLLPCVELEISVTLLVEFDAQIANDKQFVFYLSLIHISEPTRRTPISYAVFCL